MDPLKRLETNSNLANLLSAWEVLRKTHREFPAQAVTVLLYVASHNPCHKLAIEEDMGLNSSSSSRMITFLTSIGRPGVKESGVALLKAEKDQSNRRRILLSLTTEGEALVKEISAVLFDC